MNLHQDRRAFLNLLGKGVLATALGPALAIELGLASRSIAEEAAAAPLHFGDMEPLVSFMQETPVAQLQAALAQKLQKGTALKELVAAGALANARTFGGQDYVGFHTIMALAPALHMAESLPAAQAALPVFKVLYRNTARIQEFGGRTAEVLHAVTPSARPSGDAALALKQLVRGKRTAEAEALLASLASPEEMMAALLPSVHEDQEVHRTVLPSRAWDLLPVVGQGHALTLLRQSLRYCLRAEQWRRPEWSQSAEKLAALMSDHGLPVKNHGTQPMDDSRVTELAHAIFSGSPLEGATAAARALAAGSDPAHVGEAISLAANQLLLRDHGRRPNEEVAGKPLGSVHGDSIGVHASDSSNAWRRLARTGDARNACACLILGAWQAAGDRANRGGSFLEWEPLPLKQHLDGIRATTQTDLLRETGDAIRGNLQARASALVHHMGTLGQAEKPVFDLLLKYAVSEDGALHAEKYYGTVREEFATTRAALRWRHLAALARVTASEFGRPAAGQAEAREILGLPPGV